MTKTVRNGNGYTIPAPLVHRVIVSIVFSILGIGGYMLAWAINDAARQAEQEARLDAIELQTRMGVLPRADERLNDHERRIRRLEGQQ